MARSTCPCMAAPIRAAALRAIFETALVDILTRAERGGSMRRKACSGLRTSQLTHGSPSSWTQRATSTCGEFEGKVLAKRSGLFGSRCACTVSQYTPPESSSDTLRDVGQVARVGPNLRPGRVGHVEVSRGTPLAEAYRTSRTRRHTQSIVACRTHPIISERHVATQESRRATSRIRSCREGRPRVEASGRHVEPRLKRRVSLSHAVDPTFRRVATTLELYNLSRSASRRIKTDDLPNEAGCGFLLASTSRSTMTRSF
mmetsp:Transcript_9311/g.22133  ORF Transcript_9311/g.22133 Transcript_9311/m.22133 type:complete len:258 (-) Transcript_9311:120-893(-)